MTTQVDRLPFGVGKRSAGWIAVIVASLALFALGVFAYSLQLREGEVVTGMRDVGTMAGAPWGLYIAFVVYFIGVSFAGITIAVLIRLFNLTDLKPIARMAELLTVISLLLGAFSVVVDLGQPLRGIVNLFRYARPGSPFFGTFTLVVAGYLFASLVYFYLDGRRDAAIMAKKADRFQGFYRLWAAGYKGTPAERERHNKTSFWLAIAILPLLVVAHSTLGFVFGLQVGRPGWFSGLQAPGFVILAGASGIGMLSIVAAILRRLPGAAERIGDEVFRWLNRFLLVMILLYLYFMLVEWLTTSYAAHHHEARISEALLTGEYSGLFWTVVAAFVISFLVLVASYLPQVSGIRLPAYRPARARWIGAGVIAVAIVLIVQALPATQQAGLSLTTSVSTVLTWLFILLLAGLAVTVMPLFQRNVIASAVVSGILVNIAAVAKRFLIVVPSQTHGTLLPYSIGSYNPTWVEYSVILGLCGLGILLFALFIKVFPIIDVQESFEGGH